MMNLFLSRKLQKLTVLKFHKSFKFSATSDINIYKVTLKNTQDFNLLME